MGFRIKPQELDVPKEEPFRNDLLGRKEPAEILTHLVGSSEGPCVMAVDAAWGTGKTTFLRMWARHLRNEGFPVVEFNAWETDFSGDPLIALSTELTESLRDSNNGTLEARIERTMELAKEVIRGSLPGAIRIATGGVLDLQPLLENGVSEYKKARKALKEFRESLQEMAEVLAESYEGRPLVVVIDELDRCRPSYAVELLETAKHLFAVDGVIFVLALNRSELAHSIKSLYGGEFDATGYLRRFLDLEFRLPDPDRAAFIDSALDAVRISDYFERTADQNAKDDQEEKVVRDWLRRFFSTHDLGLRRIAKAIHHLGLVFASLHSDQRSYAITAAVALIVRTVDLDLYLKFARGEATDLAVVDRVFVRSTGLAEIQQENAGCLFEAMIILAAHEVAGVDQDSIDSPLLERYQKQVDGETSDPSAKKHAEAVLRRLKSLLDESTLGDTGQRFGFNHTVQRLELLSPGLIRERTGEDSLHP